jgi:curli biogenesis system outer membrane secretion channel CsgG
MNSVAAFLKLRRGATDMFTNALVKSWRAFAVAERPSG